MPWHQRDAYVGRLLRLGHKVAICDQLEDPSQAKGIVQRGVTEVLTPGSVTGDHFLDPTANNFLAAVWPTDAVVGVCLADASTGEVKLAEISWSEAPGWLSRRRVAEWVIPIAGEIEGLLAERLDAILRGLTGARSPVPASRFGARETLLDRWDPETLRGLEDLAAALAAATAALDYLDRVQGGLARQLTRVERWSEDEILRYDDATARHLELFHPQPGGETSHTLLHHVNLAVTAGGSRRLRSWLERPLAERSVVEKRHDAVQAWIEAGAERAGFRERIEPLPDLDRLSARIACAKATPRDLGALRDALALLPAIAASLARVSTASIEAAPPELSGMPELEERLRSALVLEPPPVSREGGVIRAGYDARRDELDDLAHSGKRWIAELESSERARTGITSLKVGYNRVFGFYLEVTRPHLDKVPSDYERRQTLTTAERFVTPALKLKEGEVLSAEEKLKAREHDLFVELREGAARFVPALQRVAASLAVLDAESALAEAAARYGWTRPIVNDSDRLVLENARHPVVERLLPRGEFVPNQCRLDARRQILLLTGPNMGGKSTYLRQTALVVLLAQAGSFVPAESAEIGLVDRLFTRVGAADRLGAGQSTFMVEMTETADILRSATSRSLVLLDEVGRGTSTYDGLALAWAVTEHLHASQGPRPRTIFATHYHELTQLAERLPRLANVHVSVREWGDQVVFLHRIAEGAADRSYGIHVARLAGMPADLIERARQVLAELEAERTVDHLQRAGSRSGDDRDAQLGLFAGEEHPLLAALRAVELDRLTPLQALNVIAEWKKSWS
jgi:DNA mismatch repair protein MutS